MILERKNHSLTAGSSYFFLYVERTSFNLHALILLHWHII